MCYLEEEKNKNKKQVRCCRRQAGCLGAETSPEASIQGRGCVETCFEGCPINYVKRECMHKIQNNYNLPNYSV